jgi:translation initiation factor IF-3
VIISISCSHQQVKVIVQFKGRELQYKDLGKELLLKLYQPLEGFAVMESSPKIEGKAYAMLLGPKK